MADEKTKPTAAAANTNPPAADQPKSPDAVKAEASKPEVDPSEGYSLHVRFEGRDIYTNNPRYAQSLAERGGSVSRLTTKRK